MLHEEEKCGRVKGLLSVFHATLRAFHLPLLYFSVYHSFFTHFPLHSIHLESHKINVSEIMLWRCNQDFFFILKFFLCV